VNECIGGTEVVAIDPHAGEPLDDCRVVPGAGAAVLLRDGVAHEPGERGPSPAALGRQQLRHVLVEIELRPFHDVWRTSARLAEQAKVVQVRLISDAGLLHVRQELPGAPHPEEAHEASRPA